LRAQSYFMKKINFVQHVLPHLVAVAVFLVVTMFFFSPVFFENKSLAQQDIQQWDGSSRLLRDYRDQTGKEGLWAENMFSGMPAFLINVEWSNKPVSMLKKVMSLGLPHPITNIFLCFACYYIMLLAFRVRPYLAIAGAIAFGLSSYVIIGLSAGHNARIGAIAFMPLVMAGIHLAFSGRKILGAGITTAAIALELRENHLQITYYLFLVIVAYGIVQLIYFFREQKISEYFKTIGVLVVGALLAVGSFVGPLWAIAEYTQYTIRGKSELATTSTNRGSTTGLNRDYAFEYSNGILEPMTMLVPNFYGGSSSHYLVNDPESDTYKALMRSGNEQMANQLARFTSSYWGPQPFTAPYYAGATIIFLFAIGLVFADKKMIWWLVPVSLFAIALTWGSNFETFNYFLFDYLPGYNKFRSVTFALIIPLMALPLLGLLGLEKILTTGLDKPAKKKLLIAMASTGGLCLLLAAFGGMFNFLKDGENNLPAWFLSALVDDRRGLLQGDAFRSFAFIGILFALIYFDFHKKISPLVFYVLVVLLVTIDIAVVDRRYITKDNFIRKVETSILATKADEEILKDTSYYRVYNLADWYEARTSYFHNALGGYHGARLRRYQDLYDSCISRQTGAFIQAAQSGGLDFRNYGVLNMLNVKYYVYGPDANNIIPNPAANGSAWFVKNVVSVNSPNEELKKVCEINTLETAVIDVSRFQAPTISFDSAAIIRVVEHQPNYLRYQSHSTVDGMAVFSEIYYPAGWIALIDGKEVTILQADYALRALAIPAGNHSIEFKFEPKAYYTGNTVTMASSWLIILVLLGSLGYAWKEQQ